MAQIDPRTMADLAQRRLMSNQQRNTGLQQLGQQYNTTLSNLDSYLKNSQGQVNEKFGNQGMFGSSMRLNAQGQLQQEVGQRRGYLSQKYAQDQSGINNSWQNSLQGINEQQNQYQIQAERDELARQQQQQQIDAQNRAAAAAQAASMRQQQQAAAPQQPQGPSDVDLQNWFTEVKRQQDAIALWNATIAWNNALAQRNPTRDEYAGFGNFLGAPGARFK